MPIQTYNKLCGLLRLQTLLVAIAAATPPIAAQTVTVYQTNADQTLLLAQQPSVSFGGSATGSATITLDPGVTYQQMDGFGASFTDSSAYLAYNKLTSAQQSSLMQSLFSSSNGIGLSFLRQPMGASDFSAQGNFSYDDMPSGETDVNLTNFSISKDLTYTIPVLKQAFGVNPNLKVEMLPWSPPGWMKTTGTMNGGNFNTSYYSSLANYFVKAIQAYQAQGIPVYAIAAQNEPENSSTSYPTESFSASQEATFISSYLGPALAANNLNTKIFGYEHNLTDITYPESILSGSAYSYIAGTSWHCYSGGNVTTETTLHEEYPDKGNWSTECTGQAGGNFGADIAWAMENQIIGGPRNYSRAELEWNIALDQNNGPTNGGCTTCAGLVTINDSTNPATVSFNDGYYAFGHASKFVTPGAYVIESNSANPGAGGIEDVAFQNPNGSIALIAFNDGSSAATFNVKWAPNSETFTSTLPAGAVATYTWLPTSGSLPGPPSNLTATATASGNQINLTWTQSSTTGVTYNVYRSTASGFTPSSSNLIVGSVAGTAYSDTGLSPSTVYYYIVDAANVNGVSSNSNQANATTAGAGAISSSAYYILTNQASGSCVDDDGNNGNGTALQQWQCGSGNLNQQWWFWSQNDEYYVIGNYNTNATVWTVGNAGTTNNTPVIQGSWAYGVNQEWQPILLSSGYYEFVDRNSGLCLNVPGGATTNGLQLEINTCNQSLSELFALTNAAGGAPAAPSTLAAINTSSTQINLSWAASTTGGVTYSVFRGTTSGFTPSAGNQVKSGLTSTIYSDTGLAASTAYYYVVEAINSAGSSPASNQASANTGSAAVVNMSDFYVFPNRASGSCVDDDGSTSSGTVVQQWQCISGNTNQEWWFWQQSNGYYVMGNYNTSSTVWTVTNGGTTNNTPVEQLTWSGENYQQWEPFPVSSGYYEFVDLNSGLCLNVPNGSSTNGLQLQIYTCNGATSEQFQLTPQ